MPHTFPNIGNAAEFVGQTPGQPPALFVRRAKALDNRDRPTRASAAVQGDRPTINAGARLQEKYAALGQDACSTIEPGEIQIGTGIS
jgi:hypothetical protein